MPLRGPFLKQRCTPVAVRQRQVSDSRVRPGPTLRANFCPATISGSRARENTSRGLHKVGYNEALLIFFSILLALILAGLAYQAAGTAMDRRRFSAPGRLVDIGGRRLHLVQSGEGSPAVVFESGISASCLNWTHIRNRVAEFTRCYSYDRASLGWSDPVDTPRMASRIADELQALLNAAEVSPPYILVGHSFGGLLVRAYAVKYPDQVAGLVLIDPLGAGEWLHASPEQVRVLQRGVKLSRRGALLARFGVVRFSLALLSGGARVLPQLIARLTSGKNESTVSRIVGEVRKMPPETWPMVQAHWCQPKSFLGMASYLESLEVSSAECAHLGELCRVPVTILSAANSKPAEIVERDAIVRSSPHGRHIIANKSGHWIHLDEPGLVVQAIRDMVELVRSG
jgi:pimeloyl-ACP methyl ester carboxylesterase